MPCTGQTPGNRIGERRFFGASIRRAVINHQLGAVCEIEPVVVETHDRGIEIAERYGFSFYEATIVATALRAGCKTLYSEDLRDGQVVARQLRVRNPFA
jgi:predicted nucleic acid-binding protein